MNVRKRPPSSRRSQRWGIGSFILFGLTVLLFRQPIQRLILSRSLLHTDSPSEATFRELADSAKNPFPFLHRVWDTRKIPQRTFVVSYLNEKIGADAALYEAAEPLLVSATMDVDTSVRELAMSALAAQNDRAISRLAVALLHDVDPEIRLLGLRYLRPQSATQALPRVIRLLDDPDLRVVTTADATLRKWTKLDFGIRIALVTANSSGGSTPSPSPDALDIIRDGVRNWKEWWKAHRSDYPPDEPSVSAHPSTPQRLPLTEFALKDLNGKTVRAADLKGKVVLLNFWTTWCPGCLTEIPDLIELQKRNSGRLVILGISLDGQTEVDEHGHSADAHDDEGRESRKDVKTEETELRVKVSEFAKDKSVDYTILLDPKNEAGGRFNGGELPTNVLIDPQGFVRRRFLGGRTVAVFERMIDELAPKPPDGR